MKREHFVEDVARLARSVYNFHERFNIAQMDVDDAISTLVQRQNLMVEEIGEVSRALNRGQREQAIAESVDVAYIALGTLLVMGNEGVAAMEAVKCKNDAKTKDSYREGASGKIIENVDPL